MALLRHLMIMIWLLGVVDPIRAQGREITSEEDDIEFLEEYYTALLDKELQAAEASFASLADLKNEKIDPAIGQGRNITSEEDGIKFLDEYYKGLLDRQIQTTEAGFANQTDLKNETKSEQTIEPSLGLGKYIEKYREMLKEIPWKTFKDRFVRRQFQFLSMIGEGALPDEKRIQLNKLKSDMRKIYSTAKNEDDQHKNMTVKKHDPDHLAQLWTSWRDATGKKMRTKFSEYLQLMNEAAKINGYSDAGAMWRGAFESEDFLDQLEALWQELRPFYENLHAYIRRQLIIKYGSDVIQEDGPIPAQLMNNLSADTMPFPSLPSIDATPKMLEKKMTPLQMLKTAEEFFTSLGLKAMTPSFWEKSIIEKPKDREIVCHPSSTFGFKRGDYRIKMCTEVNMRNLFIMHHEMGHVQYFMHYAHQPPPFRAGANPGFHEAIGDTIALSVATPSHLKEIGLLEEVPSNEEADINYLYSVALRKVVLLPFTYLVDLWRWHLFNTDAIEETLNRSWWQFKLQYQGVCPPTKRTEEDLDAGATYHVGSSVPYIRYFVSRILQFQFHKALCEKAGHKGPLHTCDIYNSKEAGEVFARMLQEGRRLPWPEALEILTGQRTMSAQPLLEYFGPLLKWLEEQNKGKIIGWRSTDPMQCPRRPTL